MEKNRALLHFNSMRKSPTIFSSSLIYGGADYIFVFSSGSIVPHPTWGDPFNSFCFCCCVFKFKKRKEKELSGVICSEEAMLKALN